MSGGKLAVRIAVITVGLFILAGAYLVSRDGSTSRDAASPDTGNTRQVTGQSGTTGSTL